MPWVFTKPPHKEEVRLQGACGGCHGDRRAPPRGVARGTNQEAGGDQNVRSLPTLAWAEARALGL